MKFALIAFLALGVTAVFSPVTKADDDEERHHESQHAVATIKATTIMSTPTSTIITATALITIKKAITVTQAQCNENLCGCP